MLAELLEVPHSDYTTATIIAGLALYSTILVGSLILYLWAAYTKRYVFKEGGDIDSKALSVEVFFKLVLSWFLLLRIAWLILHLLTRKQNTMTFILSRLSLFFTAYTTVVFYWAENIRAKGTLVLPSSGIIFIVFNLIVWIFQIVIVVVWALDNPIMEGGLYQTNVLTEIVLSTSISFAFLLYGIKHFRGRISSEDNADPRKIRDAVSTLIVTTLFTCCFLLRAAIYLYRLISSQVVEGDLFLICTLYVPEAVPTVLQLFLLESSKGKAQQTSQFFEGLYSGHTDALITDVVPNYYSSAEYKRNRIN